MQELETRVAKLEQQQLELGLQVEELTVDLNQTKEMLAQADAHFLQI